MSEENDKKINDALQENEESIRDIIRTAYASFPDTEERDMTLVSSGFALGWTSLSSEEKEPEKEYNLSGSVQLLASTLHRLDDLILAGALDAAEAEAVRNPVAKFIMEHKEARNKAILAQLRNQYGILAGSLLAEGRIYTDEEAMEIGISCATLSRGPIFGFVVFLGDNRVKCQCPAHLEAALVEHRITEEQANAALKAKYGTTQAAITAFGHWFGEQIRKRLTLRGEYAELDPGTLDTDEAGKLSSGLFSRLMFHGKEGEGS